MDMIDCVGVPEFWVTTVGKIENAGGNCMRLYCCIERGGVLIPQLTIVAPMSDLMVAARQIESAMRIGFADGATAH